MPGVDPAALAPALCERLNQELPRQVRVRESGGQLEFLLDGEMQEQLSFAEVFDSKASWQDAAESAIWNILDKLQDFMIEVMEMNTWPGESGFGGRAEVS